MGRRRMTAWDLRRRRPRHAELIVWIASFPRSGNSFLRIVLHRCFGIRSSVVYDFDGAAARVGPAVLGYQDRPASYEEMRASPDPHFIKTHKQCDDRIDPADKAICLVRDGRDALVSYARQRSEPEPERYEEILAALIETRTERGTGGWGQNVMSWLQPAAASRSVLRYQDLITHPLTSVGASLREIGLDSPAASGATVPSFAELHALDPLFFRRGHSRTYEDEMPRSLEERFWSIPDNSAAMAIAV